MINHRSAAREILPRDISHLFYLLRDVQANGSSPAHQAGIFFRIGIIRYADRRRSAITTATTEIKTAINITK